MVPKKKPAAKTAAQPRRASQNKVDFESRWIGFGYRLGPQV